MLKLFYKTETMKRKLILKLREYFLIALLMIVAFFSAQSFANVENLPESENNSIKISIIIPVYNTAPYLRRCLDSAINQTLEEIEIICVNDGSTDNSLEILQEYAQKDKRIKLINFENNKGVATARNEAIKIATGEFLGFLDSDDWMENELFEYLYKNSSNFDVIKGVYLRDGYYYPQKKYSHIIGNIFRRQFLLDNKIEFPQKKIGEDGAFYREFEKYNARINLLEDNNIYYHYERRLGSAMNWTPEQLKPQPGGIRKR